MKYLTTLPAVLPQPTRGVAVINGMFLSSAAHSGLVMSAVRQSRCDDG